MKYIILSVVIGAGIAGALYLHPSTTEYRAERATSTPERTQSTKTPLDESREEIERATARLASEEARLLAEIGNATSTAATEIQELERQIANIEARRDSEVAELEKGIEKINEVRSSF